MAAAGAHAAIDDFDAELAAALKRWVAAGKRGVWLKVPAASARLLGVAIEHGFDFHHALPGSAARSVRRTADSNGGAGGGYVQLTRWLPPSPSPLPPYAFTQIGVGGVVLNSAGEVLMVVEKVSGTAVSQGCWKLPGGLADPGEDFGVTAAREVMRPRCGRGHAASAQCVHSPVSKCTHRPGARGVRCGR